MSALQIKNTSESDPHSYEVFAMKSIPRNETLVDCMTSKMARSINIKFGTQAPFHKNFRWYENY